MVGRGRGRFQHFGIHFELGKRWRFLVKVMKFFQAGNPLNVAAVRLTDGLVFGVSQFYATFGKATGIDFSSMEHFRDFFHKRCSAHTFKMWP
jgi:hypothetical protein